MSRRCAFYLRVSSDGQTYENQRPALEQLARARGFEVVKVYEETGSAVKARPVFDALMDDARRGAFDVLVIWALDRLGRSMAGNYQTIVDLDRYGVTTVSIRESWLDTTASELVRNLLILVFSHHAQNERSMLVERTKAGLDRARAQGKKLGRPPARFDKALALELEAQGESQRNIAMRLRVPRRTIRDVLDAAAAGRKMPSAEGASK